MRRLLSVAVCYAAFGVSAINAASFGSFYDSYRDLHKETSYGSLFFNEGAIRYRDSRKRKRFRAVVGKGDLDLPSQQGYCFVFNHFTDNPDASTRTYRAKISKTFEDGRVTVEPFVGQFSPTDDVVSSILPDLCISALRNVSKVTIEFGSDDANSFDWQISFTPK